jgi:hypothetical protein
LRHLKDHPVLLKDSMPQFPQQAWMPAATNEGSQCSLMCNFGFLHLVEALVAWPAPNAGK